MAIDLAIPARRAALDAMKGDAALTAIVPPASIQPVGVPVWPFVRWGVPAGIPVRGSCVDGSEITVAVHSFAKPLKNGSDQVIETAEDHCGRVGSAVIRSLGGRRFAIPGGTAKFTYTSFQGPMIDGDEADAYHHVANFRVRCIA